MNCYIQVGILYGALALLALLALVYKGLKKKSKAGFSAKFLTYVLITASVIAAAWLPHHALSYVLALIGGLAAFEISSASQKKRKYKFASPLFYALTAVLIILGAEWLSMFNLFKVIVFLLLCHVSLMLAYKPEQELLAKIAVSTASILYVPVFLGTLIAIQKAYPAGFAVVFLYMIIVATDAFAQITGELFGRTKMTPELSPKKTVEGAIGGVIAGTVAAFFMKCCLPNHSLAMILLFGFVISVSSQVGDLIVSSWKRNLGIKDFSGMLGAHGGVIDRFDSMLFASGIFFLMLV